MTAREKLLKRRPKELDIDGEKFYLRALTIAEGIKAGTLDKDKENHREFVGFVLSCGLTDDSGEVVFTGPDDPGIENIPMDLVTRLLAEITSLSQVGKFKATEKNLDATA